MAREVAVMTEEIGYCDVLNYANSLNDQQLVEFIAVLLSKARERHEVSVIVTEGMKKLAQTVEEIAGR